MLRQMNELKDSAGGKFALRRKCRSRDHSSWEQAGEMGLVVQKIQAITRDES